MTALSTDIKALSSLKNDSPFHLIPQGAFIQRDKANARKGQPAKSAETTKHDPLVKKTGQIFDRSLKLLFLRGYGR